MESIYDAKRDGGTQSYQKALFLLKKINEQERKRKQRLKQLRVGSSGTLNATTIKLTT